MKLFVIPLPVSSDLLPDHPRVHARTYSCAASARKSPTLPPVMATKTSNVMGTPEESVPAAG
jgi:hypothetical protein